MNGDNADVKKRIAIVSKRRCVADFFALEAELLGLPSEIMPIFPTEPEGYYAIIADCDAVIPDALAECECLYRLFEGNGSGDIPWPTPIGTVKKIYEGLPICDVTYEVRATEDVLYLLDDSSRTVIYKNQRIILTESEWKVLLRFAESDGDIVSRDSLRELFGASDGNITDVYVCHLRRKLEDPFGIKFIKTVRARGYRFTVRIIKIYT